MATNPKWKQAERRFAAALQDAAGRVDDPRLSPLVTSTGRVGHLTDLGFDILVGNGPVALVGEAKRRKAFFVAEAVRALVRLVRIGAEWGRTPALCVTLPDDVPAFVDTNNGKHRVPRDWVLLPLPFVVELLKARRGVEQ